MNDETGPTPAPPPTDHLPPTIAAKLADPPAVLIEAPLEGSPRVFIRAATLGDECRVRAYITNGTLARIVDEALREAA